MSETSPQPNVGSDDEKEKIRRTVEGLGLTGAANDVKWGRLIDAMRLRDDWTPPYRFNCVDSDYSSRWDVEWWYHLPFPMVSVRWFDIGCWQEISRGRLLETEIIDHSSWIMPLLDEAGFCYDIVGDIVRLHGYLPKSFEGLNAPPESEQVRNCEFRSLTALLVPTLLRGNVCHRRSARFWWDAERPKFAFPRGA